MYVRFERTRACKLSSSSTTLPHAETTPYLVSWDGRCSLCIRKGSLLPSMHNRTMSSTTCCREGSTWPSRASAVRVRSTGRKVGCSVVRGSLVPSRAVGGFHCSERPGNINTLLGSLSAPLFSCFHRKALWFSSLFMFTYCL